MATVDLAAVKRHLNITDTDSDAELTDFLSAANTMLASIVGPLSGSGLTGRCVSDGSVMPLPTMPVQSVDTMAALTDLDTALTPADYTLDKPAGVLYDVPPGTYTVTYTGGWVDLPDDLALAVKELVRHLWATQRGRPSGRQSNLDAAPVDAFAIPNRVLELVAPYRPIRVG